MGCCRATSGWWVGSVRLHGSVDPSPGRLPLLPDHERGRRRAQVAATWSIPGSQGVEPNQGGQVGRIKLAPSFAETQEFDRQRAAIYEEQKHMSKTGKRIAPRATNKKVSILKTRGNPPLILEVGESPGLRHRGSGGIPEHTPACFRHKQAGVQSMAQTISPGGHRIMRRAGRVQGATAPPLPSEGAAHQPPS